MCIRRKKTKPCCAEKWCTGSDRDWVSTPGKGRGYFVCVCDLRGQVTGIRVRGEDGWLRVDDMQTHTHTHTAVTQKLARREENIRSFAHGHPAACVRLQ